LSIANVLLSSSIQFDSFLISCYSFAKKLGGLAVPIKCPKCHFDNPDTQRFCGECGTKLIALKEISVSPTETFETPTEELTTGATFAGRYQIIEELGKGGMGKVYRVLDKKLNEEVALKLIRPEIALDKNTLERFQNELKLARRISHRNVGRMYELMEEKGIHFITMEYVPGEDLKSFIRRSRQLTIGTAVTLAKQVCEGLTEAHRLGVIHRDLKPSNIIIDKEGNARIMDFGIARSIKTKGITGTGVMIGTPEYMSPEQVEGKEVDQRSDIYSLGIILYEMLTGRVPFEGDTPFTIGVKQKSEMPKDPKEFNAQIPAGLSQLILRCLEKDKGKRYQSAEELHSELTSIEKGIPFTELIVPKKEPKTVKAEIKLKNLILYGAVAILLISAIVVGISLLTRHPKAIDSIAVLPFENVNKDPDLEYLCEGITDNLIDKLSQLTSLKKVIARSSVFRYKGKEIDAKVVGQELGVDALLISNLSQRGDELSINVELVKTADNSHIWGNQYKKQVSEIFDVQKEISNAITENLRLKLTGGEIKRLAQNYTENRDAFQAYLKGRYYWNKRTEENFYKGITYFNQAIEMDPNYALAYAGLADSYITLAGFICLSPKEAFPKAKQAAMKALEIDDKLAEAHNSLAEIEAYFNWDFPGAENMFKHALDLNPNYSITHFWYGIFLFTKRRMDEGLIELKRAQELDPLSLVINSHVAWGYYHRSEYEKAIEQCKKVLEMDPNFALVHSVLGKVYEQKSLYDAAIKEFQKATDISAGSREYLADLGHAYALAGKTEEAHKILEELQRLSKQKYADASDIAMLYVGLGEIDEAFQWLEKAFEERAWGLSFLEIQPEFDRIRSDPRYKELLKKIGLDK
jgi:serine/threonine protein kinase/Tfp pilus assembly protein PilF